MFRRAGSICPSLLFLHPQLGNVAALTTHRFVDIGPVAQYIARAIAIENGGVGFAILSLEWGQTCKEEGGILSSYWLLLLEYG